MNQQKINKIFKTLTIQLTQNNNNSNFFNFFLEVYKSSHFLTKFSLSFFLIILDIVSILLFLKFYKNLSIEKCQYIIKLISKINSLREISNILKRYSIIFIYDKNQ